MFSNLWCPTKNYYPIASPNLRPAQLSTKVNPAENVIICWEKKCFVVWFVDMIVDRDHMSILRCYAPEKLLSNVVIGMEAAVEVPLWSPCFDPFLGSCFGGRDEVFVGIRGAPRLTEACPRLDLRRKTYSNCDMTTRVLIGRCQWHQAQVH